MNAEGASNHMASVREGDGSCRLRRAVAFGVSLLPVALGLCLFLSWVTSLLAPAWRLAQAGSVSWVGGALLYLAVFGVLFRVLRRTSPESEARVVWRLIGLSVVLKLALVVGTLQLPLHADQKLFHHFVCEMADHRLDGETMSALSGIYDYPVWAGRVLPVHYAMRRWAAGEDVVWIRMLNVVLSTAILLATYGFSRRLLPAGRRKWAVFLMMALPFQSFIVTDYSHHLFSSFYFLLGMWCAWEMVFASFRPLRRLALSGVMGGCLLLMMWQRGVHFIAMGVWVCLLLWAGGQGIGWRRWGGLLLGLCILPMILSIPAAGRYDAWLNQYDTHRLNSVLPAFVARGWCPDSGGEYCGRYEQLDRVTPWPEKKRAMGRLVLSQIRHNAKTVCARFPAIKTAKLFLVGYASNFEEGLAAVHSPLLAWARGMRMAATPIFLGMAIWGCWGLAIRPRLQSRWLLVFLAPLLTWGAYVFMGETSPRYSIFCQPFLAMLGASALAGFEANGRGDPARGTRAWRGIALRGAVVVGGIALTLAALAGAGRLLPTHHLYADLRRGWTVDSGTSTDDIARPEMRPFEARLSLAPGSASTQARWAIPSRPPTTRVLSLYLLEARGGARAARVSIGTGGGMLFDLSLEDFWEPRYVEIDLPADAESLVFTLASQKEGTAAEGSLQFGYLTFLEGRARE